jgi:hypothetical protein
MEATSSFEKLTFNGLHGVISQKLGLILFTQVPMLQIGVKFGGKPGDFHLFTSYKRELTR